MLMRNQPLSAEIRVTVGHAKNHVDLLVLLIGATEVLDAVAISEPPAAVSF
jgi:hypothetical protein